MRAMNEFETVLVMAILILAVCAIVDMSADWKDAGVTSAGNAYKVTPMVECCVRQRTENPLKLADDGRNQQ